MTTPAHLPIIGAVRNALGVFLATFNGSDQHGYFSTWTPSGQRWRLELEVLIDAVPTGFNDTLASGPDLSWQIATGTGQLVFTYRDGLNNTVTNTATAAVPLGAWCAVALEVDARNVYLEINGAREAFAVDPDGFQSLDWTRLAGDVSLINSSEPFAGQLRNFQCRDLTGIHGRHLNVPDGTDVTGDLVTAIDAPGDWTVSWESDSSLAATGTLVVIADSASVNGRITVDNATQTIYFYDSAGIAHNSGAGAFDPGSTYRGRICRNGDTVEFFVDDVSLAHVALTNNGGMTWDRIHGDSTNYSAGGAGLVDLLVENAPPTPALELDGGNLSRAQTPNTPANQVEGSIDIKARVTLVDFSAASGNQFVVGKWIVTGDRRAYYLGVTGTGGLTLGLSSNGVLAVSADSSETLPVLDTQTAAIRAYWDDTADQVTFYWCDLCGGSVDDMPASAWQQLGTPRPLVSAGIHPSDAPVEIGAVSEGSSGVVDGFVLEACVYAGDSFAGADKMLHFRPLQASGQTIESSTQRVPGNWIQSSEDGAGWSYNEMTFSGYSTDTPPGSGALQSSVVNETAVIGTHEIFSEKVSWRENTDLSLVVYLKPIGTGRDRVTVLVTGLGGLTIEYDLASSSVLYSSETAPYTLTETSVEDVGDGWSKVTILGHLAASQDVTVRIRTSSAGNYGFMGDVRNGMNFTAVQFSHVVEPYYVATQTTPIIGRLGEEYTLEGNAALTEPRILGDGAGIEDTYYWRLDEPWSPEGQYGQGMIGAPNGWTSPDSAAAGITRDLEIRADVTLDDYTPALAYQPLGGKWLDTGNQRSYLLSNNSAGGLTLLLSSTGADFPLANSSEALPITNGERILVRATWNMVTHAVLFWWRLSPLDPWTQLGDPQSINIAAIFDSTAPLSVGTETVNYGTPGKFHQVEIWSGITDEPKYVLHLGLTNRRVETTRTRKNSEIPDRRVEMLVAADQWASGSSQAFAAQWRSGGEHSWQFRIGASGVLQWRISSDGSIPSDLVVSTEALVATDGVAQWVAVSYRQSDGRVEFETRAVGAAHWERVGDLLYMDPAFPDIHPGLAPIELGSSTAGTANPLIGKVFAFRLYDTVPSDRSPVIDMDVQRDHRNGDPFIESQVTGEYWSFPGGFTVYPFLVAHFNPEDRPADQSSAWNSKQTGEQWANSGTAYVRQDKLLANEGGAGGAYNIALQAFDPGKDVVRMPARNRFYTLGEGFGQICHDSGSTAMVQTVPPVKAPSWIEEEALFESYDLSELDPFVGSNINAEPILGADGHSIESSLEQINGNGIAINLLKQGLVTGQWYRLRARLEWLNGGLMMASLSSSGSGVDFQIASLTEGVPRYDMDYVFEMGNDTQYFNFREFTGSPYTSRGKITDYFEVYEVTVIDDFYRVNPPLVDLIPGGVLSIGNQSAAATILRSEVGLDAGSHYVAEVMRRGDSLDESTGMRIRKEDFTEIRANFAHFDNADRLTLSITPDTNMHYFELGLTTSVAGQRGLFSDYRIYETDIENATFDLDGGSPVTGWTDSSAGTGALATNAGNLVLGRTDAANMAIADQLLSLAQGNLYVLEVRIAPGSADAAIEVGSAQGLADLGSVSGALEGLHYVAFVAQAANWVRLYGEVDGQTAYVDHAILHRLNGEHLVLLPGASEYWEEEAA